MQDHPHDHQNAPSAPDEIPPDPEMILMEMAIRDLLIEKGILTAEEIRQAIEAMESRSPAKGAEIVARAWADRDFKNALLTGANHAVARFGVNMGGVDLCVVENTPTTHNVIVCTLCSCYPRALLGLPPSWYKTKEYRSRVVREPRAVLAEFGTVLPEGTSVVVHDSTADLRYMVLPMRPIRTEQMSETELASLVTRDSLIGVTSVLF